MHETELKIWTVYKHPTDYPDKYVARLSIGTKLTENVIVVDDLDTIRSIMIIDLGLTRLANFPKNDAQIVETWL